MAPVTKQKCGKRNAASIIYTYALKPKTMEHVAARVTIEEYNDILRGAFRVRLETHFRSYGHLGFVADVDHDETVKSWSTAQRKAEAWAEEYAHG